MCCEGDDYEKLTDDELDAPATYENVYDVSRDVRKIKSLVFGFSIALLLIGVTLIVLASINVAYNRDISKRGTQNYDKLKAIIDCGPLLRNAGSQLAEIEILTMLSSLDIEQWGHYCISQYPPTMAPSL